jgi:hypothetical protein
MKKNKTELITICKICTDKGWYYVNEWIGYLRGRRDCKCKVDKNGKHNNGSV